MTKVKHHITCIAILGGGIVASLTAWADTNKPWVSLVILVGTCFAEAALCELHESQEGKARE